MIAYLDCSTGVSGDKLLGALIECGFDPGLLRGALRAMGLASVSVETSRCVSHGTSGTGLTVTEPGAPRRHWAELRTLLHAAPLEAEVRSSALLALELLAEAEAGVHGVAIEDVHFHEIGAADTLADVLGVALAVHHLDIESLVVTPVAVGSGTSVTEHGELPVPAPATALLLQDMPIVAGEAVGELTTPTGAALLRAFTAEVGTVPPMTLRRVGVGCGTREIGVANVCRLLLGERLPEQTDAASDTVVQLETNLDHLTPEELATAADHLRSAGALDVWLTPIVMKKGRPATLFSLLAPEGSAASLAERVLAETGTLGVRMLPVVRSLAGRDTAEVETSLGPVRFKITHLPDGTRVLRAESDDVARISAERSLAADVVARTVEQDAWKATGVQPMRQRPSVEAASPSE